MSFSDGYVLSPAYLLLIDQEFVRKMYQVGLVANWYDYIWITDIDKDMIKQIRGDEWVINSNINFMVLIAKPIISDCNC